MLIFSFKNIIGFLGASVTKSSKSKLRRHQIMTDYFIFLVRNIVRNAGGFPGGAVVENLPANAGDTGSSPGLGRSHMPRSN